MQIQSQLNRPAKKDFAQARSFRGGLRSALFLSFACFAGCASVRNVVTPVVGHIWDSGREEGLFGSRSGPNVPAGPEQLHVPPMEQSPSGVAQVSYMPAPPSALGPSSSPIGGPLWRVSGESCLPAPICPPLAPQPVASDPLADLRQEHSELKQTVEKLQERTASLELELQSARNTVQDVSISLQTARQELSELTQEVRYWRREMQQSQAAAAQIHASDIARLDELSRLLSKLSEHNAAGFQSTTDGSR